MTKPPAPPPRTVVLVGRNTSLAAALALLNAQLILHPGEEVLVEREPPPLDRRAIAKPAPERGYSDPAPRSPKPGFRKGGPR
jgi:hypothetical protein